MTNPTMSDNFTMITRTDCVWCDRAKGLLDGRNLDCIYYSYANQPLLRLVMKKAGLKTLPQIWHGDTYIGGYTELETYLESLTDD